MNRINDLKQRVSCSVQQSVLNRWDSTLVAAEKNADNTISIYDPIGVDWWTGEGVTAKRIGAALRSIGAENDVVVNINSPGGDVFEGLAIYNLLKQHKGNVTVNIIGLAASAASFIAMAGDKIQMAKASFLMMHNAWVFAGGNRHELAEIAQWLEQFDTTLATIYADRTGQKIWDVQAAMDKETWLNSDSAIELGYADNIIPDTDTAKDPDRKTKNSLHKLDAALVQAGMPRSERKAILKDITAMRNAGEPETTRNAGEYDFISNLKLNL